MPSRCARPSIGTTVNQEFCSNRNDRYLSLCMNCIGSGVFIERVMPKGRQAPV